MRNTPWAQRHFLKYLSAVLSWTASFKGCPARIPVWPSSCRAGQGGTGLICHVSFRCLQEGIRHKELRGRGLPRQTPAVTVWWEPRLLCEPEELRLFLFLTDTTLHKYSSSFFNFYTWLCDTGNQTQTVNACKASSLLLRYHQSFTCLFVCACIVCGNVGASLLLQTHVALRRQPQVLVLYLLLHGQWPFKLPKILCLLPMSPQECCLWSRTVTLCPWLFLCDLWGFSVGSSCLHSANNFYFLNN